MDAIKDLMGDMEPLHEKKDPGLACALGFLFGGIGLAIYFQSFVDLIFPIGIAIVAVVVLGEVGLLGGAIIAALYGYYRVLSSNEKLEAAAHPPVGAPAHP